MGYIGAKRIPIPLLTSPLKGEELKLRMISTNQER
jgi:hypothetical protein